MPALFIVFCLRETWYCDAVKNFEDEKQNTPSNRRPGVAVAVRDESGIKKPTVFNTCKVCGRINFIPMKSKYLKSKKQIIPGNQRPDRAFAEEMIALYKHRPI